MYLFIALNVIWSHNMPRAPLTQAKAHMPKLSLASFYFLFLYRLLFVSIKLSFACRNMSQISNVILVCPMLVCESFRCLLSYSILTGNTFIGKGVKFTSNSMFSSFDVMLDLSKSFQNDFPRLRPRTDRKWAKCKAQHSQQCRIW